LGRFSGGAQGYVVTATGQGMNKGAWGPVLYEAKLIIAGQQVDARGGATYDRLQPVSENVATRAASASVKDAIDATNAAADRKSVV